MPQKYENLILNPVELTPELPEIDLSAAGLAIGEAGPDYGEGSQTVERVKQALGEGVTSAHWPSVESSVPILVGAESETTMATAFTPVESFVAEVQRRNQGAIRREFADSAGFSGSVVTFVDAAGLTTPRGKDGIDEITLKLSRHPFWFATLEEESEEFSASEVRELEFTLAEMLGTVPGLIRVVIKNEGSEDWRGCYVSLECDDYSEAETAKPHYAAKDLTLQGGSTVATVSGEEVVKCPALTAGWVTVLSSEIEGVGHMTHVGQRRMLFRIDDPSAKADAEKLAEWEAGGEVGAKPISQQANWKLEWRALGSAAWIQTMEGSTPIIEVSPVVGGYQVIDLGEARPERPLTGDGRWEWRLQACVPSGSGVQPLIRDVYPMSTEQWMRVADNSENPIDGEPARTPGTVEDVSGVGTLEWQNPENAKLRDGTVAFLNVELGEEWQTSHYLKATNFGFALPAGADIRNIWFRLYRAGSNVYDNRVRVIQGGTIKEAVDAASPLRWQVGNASAATPVLYGGDLWDLPWTAADINGAGFGLALSAKGKASNHGEVEAIEAIVAYSEGADENRVCFSSRSIEFSDSGVRRQHVTDEIWGELVGDGFNLYAPAPGQTGQPMCGLIIPSVGDFETRADSAAATLSAKVAYRAAYLFAREAVE